MLKELPVVLIIKNSITEFLENIYMVHTNLHLWLTYWYNQKRPKEEHKSSINPHSVILDQLMR